MGIKILFLVFLSCVFIALMYSLGEFACEFVEGLLGTGKDNIIMFISGQMCMTMLYGITGTKG